MSILTTIGYLPLQILFSGTKLNKIANMIIILLCFYNFGSFFWLEGLLHVLYVIGLLNTRYLSKELADERANAPFHKDTPQWDKLLVSLMGFFLGMGPLVLGSIEGSPKMNKNLTHVILGVAVIVPNLAVFHYAMKTNFYFSSMVRIQRDRGHKVCEEGPYKYIRHPGYSCTILPTTLGIPLIFYGTKRQFVLGGINLMLIILRAQLEDNTLQKELDGYASYADKVKWKLIYFVF